ncbi:MAG TPA: AI-2E family transporter [Verrucomicrobiae bacterium]|nr:AI-2E family transporter [Verrucomicrobiae bacterium]
MNFPPPTERQARIIWLGSTGLAIALLVAVVVVFLWGLGRVIDVLSPVIWPLAVGGVLAYLLDPVVDYFERKGLSRVWAIICVFVIALLIVAGTLAYIIPPIVTQTREFASRVPHIYQKVEQRVENWLNSPPTGWFDRMIRQPQANPPETPPAIEQTNAAVASTTETNSVPPTTAAAPAANTGLGSALNKLLPSVAEWLKGLAPKAGTFIASWFDVLVGLALIPIYAFYLLLERSGIESKWTNYLPIKDSTLKDELVFILRSINSYMIAFFRGQVLVALIDGILYGLGFAIIGLPYYFLLGAAAVVLTIVPLIGAMIVFVAAMIIALVQYGDWKHPLLVVVVFAIVQALESLVVSPRVMKGRVGLHPLTIIIAVMVGTTLLGGLLGGVLAIPLTAVLRVLMERYVWKRSTPEKAS